MKTKTIIRVMVIDQKIQIVDAPLLASGGENEAVVVFDFCEKWDGFAKTATFYRDESKPYSVILDNEDTCVVPWEVYYEAGTFYFGVFGNKDETRRTSNVVKYKVKRGAATDTMPSAPTPEVYEQIMAAVAEVKTEQEHFIANIEGVTDASVEAANQAADNANRVAQELTEARVNGEFNGEKGETGDAGKDGYTPVKGKDYFDGYTPQKGIDYFDGKDGNDGRGIENIVETDEGVMDIIFTDGSLSSFPLPKGEKGEPGASSWNDLVDRPFYDETAVLYENPAFYFDDMPDGYIYDTSFLVEGETYELEVNGNHYTGLCVLGQDEFEEDSTWLEVNFGDFVFTAYPDDGYVHVDCKGKFVETYVSLKVIGKRIKTLDTKYLPEQLQFGNEETVVLYENKAMLLEAEFGDGEPPGCYWEAIGSAFLVVGKTYDVEVNGVHYSAACYDISEDGDGTYPALDVGDIYFEPYQRNDGSWRLAVYSDEFVDTTISVKISQTNIKKLESKYLPDSLMERIDRLDGESANLTEMLVTVGVEIPSINLNDGVYTYGRFATYGTEYDGDSPISKSFRNANYLRVTGGRTIALYYAKSEWNDNNAELPLQIVQYDYTKKVIGERTDVSPYAANQTTFTLNENTAYIRFCLPARAAAITTPLSDIQIAIYYIEDYVNTWISPEPTVLGDKQVLNLQNAVLPSSTAGSTKKFMLTVNDAGVISAIEMT